MRVVLKVADGPYEGRTVLLQTGQAVQVGRTERADFCVPYDDRISSLHFAVKCERQQCLLRDLDSTNGTLLNDASVTETEVHDGDVISAGRTKFAVTVEMTESVFDLDAIRLDAVSGDPSPSESAETRASAEPIAAPTDAPESLSETLRPIPPEPVVPERSSRASLDGAALQTVVDAPITSLALMLAADSARPYVAAFRDPDPTVRREALYATAWSGERWLLDYCRSFVSDLRFEHWDALHLLAILGEPSDLKRIVGIGRTAELGSRRFEIYASYGHPRVIRDLLIAIEDEDANTAVAAGTAFTKITGADIDSEERVELQPEDGSEPDEFEKEFLDEAFLPDPKLAQQHWSKVKEEFAEGTRWRRGLDLSAQGGLEVMNVLDMESRWEACLRCRYQGSSSPSLSEVLRFPNQRG